MGVCDLRGVLRCSNASRCDDACCVVGMSTAAVLNTSESHPSTGIISHVGEARKFKEVIEATRRIALTNPLGRNAEPAYVSEDMNPCCIFGHALVSLGIPHSRLKHALGGIPSLPRERWGFERPTEYQALWATKVQASCGLWGCVDHRYCDG